MKRQYLTDLEFNLLTRELIEKYGGGILLTCWLADCARPIAAVIKTTHKDAGADEVIILMCEHHAEMARRDKLKQDTQMMMYTRRLN